MLLNSSTGVFRGSGATADLAVMCRRIIAKRDQVIAEFDNREHIIATEFAFNFNGFSDLDCLVQFRFIKNDKVWFLPIFSWPSAKKHTERNCLQRYAHSPGLCNSSSNGISDEMERLRTSVRQVAKPTLGHIFGGSRALIQ